MKARGKLGKTTIVSVILIAILGVAMFTVIFKFPKTVKAEVQAGYYGLNYTSYLWDYAESNATLDVDFAMFQSDGIKLVCPWLHWSKIEPYSQGSYSSTFLNNIKRFVQKAAEYDIEVIIDFHTGSGSSKTYGMPNWLDVALGYDFDDVATNATVQGWFIDMEEYAVNYLDDEPNIHSYHLFNEFWVPIEGGLQDEYETLIQNTHDAIEPLTTRPLSIRIGPYAMITHDWISSETLWGVLDYLGLNIYIGEYSGHTTANLDTILDECDSRSLNLTITEYGSDEANDTTQANNVAAQIAIFTERGIPLTLCTQYGYLVTSHYFRLLEDDGETVRPAYEEVVSANIEEEEEAEESNYYFGTTSVYTGAVDIDDTIRGSKFNVTTGGGIAQSISVYVKSGDNYTGSAKAALYNSSTYALIGQTNEKTLTNITTSWRWEQFNFSAPKPTIYNNTEYLIVAWAETVGGQTLYVGRTATGAQPDQTISKIATYSASYPNPISSPSLSQYIISLYCNYTLASMNLSIANPKNQTYTSPAITIGLIEATGGTNPTVTYNIQYPNGTWQWGTNQTYTDLRTTYIYADGENYVFAAQAVNDEGASAYEEIYFTVLLDKTLTVESTTGGSTSPTVGDHDYADSENVTLTATPNAYYTFAAWEIDGVNETTTESTWYVVMDDDYTVKAYFSASYTLSLTVNNPDATTYNTSTIPVNLATSGSETGVTVTWNVQFANSSWLYATNQTYTTSTSFTISENLTATFCAHAVGSHGFSDYEEVEFTVSLVYTYTISLVVDTPKNMTYTSKNIPVSLSTTGNDTVSAYSWNIMFSDSTWLYLTNQTSSSKTVALTENDTYTFACYVTGANGASDYAEVEFSTSYVDVPVLPSVSVGGLWVFLYAGDLVGFFGALLIMAFTSLDIAVGTIAMVFLVPLYIRTKSLLLICIAWILVGGALIVAMPIVSVVAVLFMALGVGGLIYRLFRPSSGY